MQIRRLRGTSFRCFETFDIEPGSGLNVITGDNASGKTSLLEAIFVLGRGQSFRPSGLNTAIARAADNFTLHAEVGDDAGNTRRLGVRRSRRQTDYRVDGAAAVARLDLISAMPLQLVDPNVHRLLEQGPRYRRHFLDWGVFHVEHAFFPAWRRYRRALRQRNRALRSRLSSADIVVWDAELVRSGEQVDAARRAYIDLLRRGLSNRACRLLGSDPLEFDYTSGWRGREGFGGALAESLHQDRKAGFTQQGPHRADLRVSVANTSARNWVSRGQQKMLTTALLLAQAQILQEKCGVRPVLLIDDLAAELGVSYRRALMEEICSVGGQCFVTCLDRSVLSVSGPSSGRDTYWFHVEHGQIRAS